MTKSRWEHADHFRDLAKQVLPRDGAFDVWDDDGHLIIQSSWRLRDSTLAVSGRSTSVRILVSQEAQEDYDASSVAQRSVADDRFMDGLRQRLTAFDPKARAPIGAAAPETWVIGTRELNG